MECGHDDTDNLQRELPFSEILTIVLGLNRISPYIDRLVAISNLRYGTTLAVIVAALETFMINNSLAMSRNPDVVAKVGLEWIIHHRIAYCAQLLSALIVVAAFVFERYAGRSGKSLPLLPIKLAIAQFIVISFAFGIYVSCGDLSRSNGLYSFLTQATSIVCIFVIRPIALVPLLFGSFAFMMHAAEQAGGLSHGTSINLQILCLVLAVSSCIKYYRHMNDGSLREQLMDQSYHDPLTGLANVRAFYRDMRNLVGREIVLALLDIDNFKLYNDLLGHGTGNRALSMLASILLMEFDGDASLYRIGGDEFVIVSPANREEDTLARIRRSREALRRGAAQYGLVARDCPLSFSMGTVIGTLGNADDIEKLLHRADKAMYDEKRIHHLERG